MINKVTLLGRLARDPDLKSFNNGGKVCRLRLITSRSWTDRQSGEIREKVEGHNVAIYVEKIAERVAEKARKGDILYVEGPMETRSWTDNDNVKRSITEVAVRPFLGTIKRVPTTRTAPNPAGETDRPSDETAAPSKAPADTTPAAAAAATDTSIDNDPFDDPFLDDSFDDDFEGFDDDLAGDGFDDEPTSDTANTSKETPAEDTSTEDASSSEAETTPFPDIPSPLAPADSSAGADDDDDGLPF